MEEVSCNLCGHTDSRAVYTATDTNLGTPGQFQLVECRHCGLVYLNPRLAGAALAQAYPAENYGSYASIQHQRLTPAPLHLARARWLTQAAPPGTVLDVGCGNGLFLVAMRQRQWHAVGVEPHPYAAAFAHDHLGLEIHADLTTVPETPLDLVTLWEVLEHLPDPASTLRQLQARLKPTGYLALSVPNWASWERQWFRAQWIAVDAPRHLYHFTPHTLTRLLTQQGFTVLQMEQTAPTLSLASNLLRWLGDGLLRQGRAKASQAPAAAPALASPTPAARAALPKRLLIQAMHYGCWLPNTFNKFKQRGATITLLARKAATV